MITHDNLLFKFKFSSNNIDSLISHSLNCMWRKHKKIRGKVLETTNLGKCKIRVGLYNDV